MVKADDEENEVKGAEAIVIHNGNIILGMQKSKRWYKLENQKRAVIIKTLGGQIKAEDESSSRKTLLRELSEEVQDIKMKEIRICEIPIFTKSITMGELNPYERQSKLRMTADFYFLEILNKNNIMPNDLPALLSIPIEDFLKVDFNKAKELNDLKNYIIKNSKFDLELPEYCALMIPEEVRCFLKDLKGM